MEPQRSDPEGAGATVRHQAAAELRAAILDHEYPPGRRLPERELAERLRVSRTTVREVLGDLRATGLVTLIPQRGAIVTVLARSEAEDLYEIRHRTETLVVEKFVARATDDQVENLQHAVEELAIAAAAKAAASDLLTRRDAIFTVLLDGAQSPALSQLTEGLRARVDVLRASSIADQVRLQQSLDEWRDVVSAVRNRDYTLAIAIYGAHLRKSADVALSYLSEQWEEHS